jgi:hypothetical protein
LTIYIIYFITVAILGTAIFRLQRERNMLEGALDDCCDAFMSSDAEVDRLVADYGNLMSDGMELKQHCDGIERLAEAQAKTIADLEAENAQLRDNLASLRDNPHHLLRIIEAGLREVANAEE